MAPDGVKEVARLFVLHSVLLGGLLDDGCYGGIVRVLDAGKQVMRGLHAGEGDPLTT